MTLLAGILLNAPTFHNGNARLGPAAQTTRWVYPGPISVWAGWITAAAPIANRPWAKANPRALPGFKLPSYFDDFYNRVHVNPSAIALGNLVSSQSRTIVVWNAFIDQSLTLNTVLISNGDGMVLTPPGPTPMVFAPLQQYAWQLSVTPNGEAVINAMLQWQFTNADDDVTVTVTGNRITAWTIAPDWSNGITETLTWLTDVQQSISGNQVRQQVRNAPRRQWEFSVVAQGQDRRVMELMLYDWSARVWLMPVWPDVTFLTSPVIAGSLRIAVDTTGLDYVVGGLALLWSSSTQFEIVEVASLPAGAVVIAQPTANAWPIGARIYPCRTATLTDYPQVPRGSSNIASGQIRFQAAEPCDWPAAAPGTTYLGLPVLESRTDEPKDLGASYGRVVVTIDNDIGIPEIDDPSGQPWITQEHCWRLTGRGDRAAHRSLLYWLAGRGNAVWLPSWADDVLLVSPVPANALAMAVEWAGFTRFGALQAGRRHLRIEMIDGTIFYRTITGSIELNTSQEQLSFDSPFGIQINPSSVRQISWMMLATLASDSIEIAHETDSMGTATVATTFVGVPVEEP